MPSVVGLLEQRELAARRRVDELREEADRIQAELAVRAGLEKNGHRRSRVGEVPAPADEPEQSHDQAGRTTPAANGQVEQTPSAPGAAKPKSQTAGVPLRNPTSRVRVQ